MSLLKRFVALLRPLVDRFPRVAAIYRNMRDQLDCARVPVMTPWGFKLAGDDSMAKGTFEPAETELVRKLLEQADVFVNIGANIGYYCCHALSMRKSVIAFEPVHRNLRYLCKNIAVNNWTGVEIYPLALSNKVGVLEIYGGSTGASILKGWAGTPESYVSLVPSSTMDVILGARLLGKRAFILVDIEGAEKWMLEGATKILVNEPKPVWLVEIMGHEYQPGGFKMNPNYKGTFELFFKNGYQAFVVDQEMIPVAREDVDRVLSGQLKFEGHNFLFVDKRRGDLL